MGDELTTNEKGWAGFLLIFFTVLPAFFLIGLWPDMMPKTPDSASYHLRLFNVKLITDTTGRGATSDTSKNVMSNSPQMTDTTKKDSSIKKSEDSADAKAIRDSTERAAIKNETAKEGDSLININTLLLILVALAGFLGNMVHIATSFTTFIGAEQFKRSWILWYYVKPFTASALAIGLYFVFRGGFLTMSNDASNINLYGVMTLSLLAGLFTDKATLKLKEIFEVVFRSKEDRPDKLEPKAKIKSIAPMVIEAGVVNILTLTGENLDAKLKATINGEDVAISDTVKNTAIIKYTIPTTQKDAKEFRVLVKDGEGNTVLTETLKLTAAPAPAGAPTGKPRPIIINIAPLEIEAVNENLLTLTGENLSAKNLSATINDEDVTVTDVTANTATIKYIIPATQKDAIEFKVVVKDDKGDMLKTEILKLKEG